VELFYVLVMQNRQKEKHTAKEGQQKKKKEKSKGTRTEWKGCRVESSMQDKQDTSKPHRDENRPGNSTKQ